MSIYISSNRKRCIFIASNDAYLQNGNGTKNVLKSIPVFKIIFENEYWTNFGIFVKYHKFQTFL